MSEQQHTTTGKITKIINGRLLRNHEIVENSYIYIQDGKIIDAFHSFFDEQREPDHIIDAKGAIVSPGFIDLQINGAFGIDFSDYEGSEEKLAKDIAIVANGLLQNGCTAFCPTVVTSAPEVYSKVIFYTDIKMRIGLVLNVHPIGSAVAKTPSWKCQNGC